MGGKEDPSGGGGAQGFPVLYSISSWKNSPTLCPPEWMDLSLGSSLVLGSRGVQKNPLRKSQRLPASPPFPFKQCHNRLAAVLSPNARTPSWGWKRGEGLQEGLGFPSW